MSMHKIDLKNCDLNLLVVFEALLRERHVGRAAEALFLSQSATSHALGRLREMLGDPLFVRHPKGIEPTARAQALAAPIAELLKQARTIVAPQAAFDPAKLDRSFTLGATDYAVFVVIAPLLSRLQVRAPKLDLRVLPVDQPGVAGAFDRGAIDFALGSFPDPPHRIEALPLFEERFVGVVRRGHPRLKRGRMSLDDFVATPHALVSLSGDAHGRVDEALGSIGLKRRVAMTVAHFLALPFVVAASDMVGVLAERVAVRMADTTGIALFPLPLDLPKWTVHLLRPRQLRESPEIVWFSELTRGAQNKR
jgi:DNA-binding transcriptional LysR family regulator